jgi:glycogen synthase
LDRNIAFVTYETPFSPGGGIAAVMAHLPRSVQDCSKIPVFIISPFHFNLTKTTNYEPEMVTIGTIKVAFDQEEYNVAIKLLDQNIKWIFLKPKEKINQGIPFFAGLRHPYDVPSESANGQSVLLRDSLFFGKAVATALPDIDPDHSWTILLQDWEAATTILANAGNMETNLEINSFLTIHNSYDSGLIKRDKLQIILNPADLPGETVLECALPLVQDPIFTVSEQFAKDLSSEIFQTSIMIPHLRNELPSRLVGVNNGPFVENSVPDKAITSAQKGNYSAIHSWKTKNRRIAFTAMDEIPKSDSAPIWGDRGKFNRDPVPWFIMAGRDDSRQKGYEIACIAIDQLLSMKFPARFLFFPIPGDEGLPGIEFIRELAKKYPQQVIGFPFLFREGFFAFMRGATFGLMPSYYEPFGMANEYYLNGAVCIGRATGGITQQIVPLRHVPSFSSSVKQRADIWHESTSRPTGFLFRENDADPNALDDWLSINTANYKLGSGTSNRLHTRSKLSTVQSMANELALSIDDANILFTNQQNLYYDMVVNGIEYITLNFSWEIAARSYLEVIKQ